MKFDTPQNKLEPTNLVTMHGKLAELKTNFSFAPMLLLIAEACDRAIAGSDTYAVVGLTKDRTALLLTIREGASVLRSGGADLLELNSDAERLL